ncbi:MAG: HAMP domain-containing histidine kinase [candidate division WOR-3 bacterium]|nr:HAMP domain-containing histidine kinase [candidate division WOR-3 bacterium]
MKRNLIFVLIIILACIAGFIAIKLNNHYLEETFRQSSQNTFYLLSIIVEHYLNESEKVGKRELLTVNIGEVFDSIVKSSNLVYFAVLDEKKEPIVFSTIYDEYLPIRGEGEHFIKTPAGNIFQIEKKMSDKYFISGFALKPIEKIRQTNNILFLIILGTFVVITLILFARTLQFEKYKIAKEDEIAHLKEISGLAAGFSHEFRNSLHTLSLLAHELEGEEKKILNDEVERLRQVMDSLKLLSQTEIKREQIKIEELYDDILSMAKGTIPEGLNIKANIEKNLCILGDPVLLKIAFLNLIRNSIEAQARNIEIKSNKRGNSVLIEITDDGTGIEKKEIPHIFEPFYSKKGQTGLGLYLVKKIITAHNGNIQVFSNHGTKFLISLNEGKI